MSDALEQLEASPSIRKFLGSADEATVERAVDELFGQVREILECAFQDSDALFTPKEDAPGISEKIQRLLVENQTPEPFAYEAKPNNEPVCKAAEKNFCTHFGRMQNVWRDKYSAGNSNVHSGFIFDGPMPAIVLPNERIVIKRDRMSVRFNKEELEHQREIRKLWNIAPKYLLENATLVYRVLVRGDINGKEEEKNPQNALVLGGTYQQPQNEDYNQWLLRLFDTKDVHREGACIYPILMRPTESTRFANMPVYRMNQLIDERIRTT